MAKKDRNNITQSVNSKIYDNDQKEIVAQYVREVFADYKDSFFNLIDDRLNSLMYDDTQTLSQVINQMGLILPMWGASGYFDPGSSNAPEIGNCEGIVTSAVHTRMTKNDSRVDLTLNIDLSILQKGNIKFIVIITTENYQNIDAENDLCTPVFTVLGSTIRVGVREVSTGSQRVRLEVFGFNVKK